MQPDASIGQFSYGSVTSAWQSPSEPNSQAISSASDSSLTGDKISYSASSPQADAENALLKLFAAYSKQVANSSSEAGGVSDSKLSQKATEAKHIAELQAKVRELLQAWKMSGSPPDKGFISMIAGMLKDMLGLAKDFPDLTSLVKNFIATVRGDLKGMGATDKLLNDANFPE